MFKVRKVIQMLNHFLELVQNVADINHLLELIVFVLTKESNLHINGDWILLNVLNESHIYSSITSSLTLCHCCGTWVLEEKQFFQFVISNSKSLVLFKGSGVEYLKAGKIGSD